MPFNSNLIAEGRQSQRYSTCSEANALDSARRIVLHARGLTAASGLGLGQTKLVSTLETKAAPLSTNWRNARPVNLPSNPGDGRE